jgi:hypothetical protein
MHPVIRVLLLTILVLVSGGGTAPAQHASASLAKPIPAPTPFSLAEIPLQAQSALASLQEIDDAVSRDQSSADGTAGTLLGLTSEIDSRIDDDSKLLTTSPTLEMLYRFKLTWQNFGGGLSASARDLTQHATSLGEQLAHLDQLGKTWQVTLQLAKQPETPPLDLQSVQRVIDSVERTRKAAESVRTHILDLQSHISEEEARVRTVLSSIEQAENQALKSLFVRDRPPIWSVMSSLGTEWEKHSGESFSSQLKTSAAFTKRLPFTFLNHALLVALMATALHWMRRRIRKLAEEKPELQRALPILDLPVSTAFALSIPIIPAIYGQAPRLIHAFMGTATLIPTVRILRRLLERNSYPLLDALVILYFVGQLRVLAASLPVLARFIFLGQMLGASIFLVWLLRRWNLPAESAESHGRLWRAIRAIAKIGLILLPAAFLANIFGYVNLANLLGLIFLRSANIGFVLYTSIRIIEGLIVIALQVRPLGPLRVISLHRQMIQLEPAASSRFSLFYSG